MYTCTLIHNVLHDLKKICLVPSALAPLRPLSLICCTCLLARHSQGGDGGLLKTGLQAERAVVEEQRSHLTRELASLRLAVEQMEKDILQTRESISQLGESEADTIQGNH